jgi:hypothetical protein
MAPLLLESLLDAVVEVVEGGLCRRNVERARVGVLLQGLDEAGCPPVQAYECRDDSALLRALVELFVEVLGRGLVVGCC